MIWHENSDVFTFLKWFQNTFQEVAVIRMQYCYLVFFSKTLDFRTGRSLFYIFFRLTQAYVWWTKTNDKGLLPVLCSTVFGFSSTYTIYLSTNLHYLITTKSAELYFTFLSQKTISISWLIGINAASIIFLVKDAGSVQDFNRTILVTPLLRSAVCSPVGPALLWNYWFLGKGLDPKQRTLTADR